MSALKVKKEKEKETAVKRRVMESNEARKCIRREGAKRKGGGKEEKGKCRKVKMNRKRRRRSVHRGFNRPKKKRHRISSEATKKSSLQKKKVLGNLFC